MSEKIRNYILNNEKKVQRMLEILPAFVSYNIILFPYWGILIIPNVVAYFILFFNIYYFFYSFQIAMGGVISHFRIQASIQYDWLKDLKTFSDWKKVNHIVIIPTYKEPLYILKRTIKSIKDQTLPRKQITVVLAMETKEDKHERLEKVKEIKKEFGETFANLFVTVHTLLPGEAAGKSSNERHAALWVKKNFLDRKSKSFFNYTMVSICDADHKYHKSHFACLTFKFLDNPNRYLRFWQPAILFYNNIWKIPAITRVTNTLSSIVDIALLARKDVLITTSNYALSFKLLDEAGYWDPDKIPEDWGIFFKTFYEKKGGVEVEPIYLPIYADAAIGTSVFKTLKNEYEQKKRWAWGVSDDPWLIKNYLLSTDVPFWDKTLRAVYAIKNHFLWPVHFFIVSIGLQLPILLNPRFAKTALGYTVPKISSYALSLALFFLVLIILIDRIYKPKKPKEYPLWKALLFPLEFVLMPVAGFLFTSLPGLDAHTRLMLGKYIEYKVTEKV